MSTAVATYLPWLLSAITIWMTLLAGNLHRNAWLVGLANQALWAVWILTTGTWGLIPLNIALWVVYGRNHLRWQRVQPRRFRDLEADRVEQEGLRRAGYEILNVEAAERGARVSGVR